MFGQVKKIGDGGIYDVAAAERTTGAVPRRQPRVPSAPGASTYGHRRIPAWNIAACG